MATEKARGHPLGFSVRLIMIAASIDPYVIEAWMK